MYALLKTQKTAPERKRNASEADKRQANKEQTILIRTAGGSTCPAATRLLGKPGLLHTPIGQVPGKIATQQNETNTNPGLSFCEKRKLQVGQLTTLSYHGICNFFKHLVWFTKFAKTPLSDHCPTLLSISYQQTHQSTSTSRFWN